MKKSNLCGYEYIATLQHSNNNNKITNYMAMYILLHHYILIVKKLQIIFSFLHHNTQFIIKNYKSCDCVHLTKKDLQSRAVHNLVGGNLS